MSGKMRRCYGRRAIFRAKGFRMIAYGVDTLLMQTALADGIKLLQGTVTK